MNELQDIERFVRAIVLHDEMSTILEPWPSSVSRLSCAPLSRMTVKNMTTTKKPPSYPGHTRERFDDGWIGFEESYLTILTIRF